jgi:hypothetical protein
MIAMPLGLADEAMGRATKPDRSGHAYGDEWAGVWLQPVPSQAQCSMVTLGGALAGKSSLARSLLAGVWRVVRAVPLGLVMLLIFVEEWGWGPLSALVGHLARWAPIAAVESHIRRSPPRVALALFLFPALLLVPVKLAALYLIRDGRVTLGVAIIVTAKLVGTALGGRLFILVETQLMEFAWFAICVAWWRATRDRIMASVRASFLWRYGRALRRTLDNWRLRHAPIH